MSGVAMLTFLFGRGEAFIGIFFLYECKPDISNRLHEMRLKAMTPGAGGKFLFEFFVFGFWFLVELRGWLSELQLSEL